MPFRMQLDAKLCEALASPGVFSGIVGKLRLPLITVEGDRQLTRITVEKPIDWNVI